MIKIRLFNFLWILSYFLFVSNKPCLAQALDNPTIKAGTAKVSGRITNPNLVNKDSVFVNLFVPHPISGQNVQYRTFIDQSGRFSIDVDVETDITLINLYTSINQEKQLYIKLKNGSVTNVDIAFNSDSDIENVHTSPNMNQKDITNGVDMMMKMLTYRSSQTPEALYNKGGDYFVAKSQRSVLERIEILNNDPSVSKEFKGFLSKELLLFLYTAHVFDYQGEMLLNYQNTGVDKSKKPDIQEIDKVVFFDLWATWCAPCLNSMQDFRPTRDEFRNKDVVFVYLTNSTSPRKLWEEKIKGIGHEHYYLTDAQWGYIMEHFNLEYIPSYLLYNKEGLLSRKFTPFPGRTNKDGN